MGRQALYLSAPLEAERTWELDGVTVLAARVRLPQAEGPSRRARRFNRYYRRFCRSYFFYCEQELAPRARRRCAAALERSRPWEPLHASLDYTLSFESDALWSVVVDGREEAPRCCLRRADTWDRVEALPLPMQEFFPTHARLRRRLLTRARSEAARRIEAGEAAYCEEYRPLLRRYLNLRSYYLTPEGLCWFYPMYLLGDAAEGVVTFCLPYDAENGPYPPP